MVFNPTLGSDLGELSYVASFSGLIYPLHMTHMLLCYISQTSHGPGPSSSCAQEAEKVSAMVYSHFVSVGADCPSACYICAIC